uniref:Uncharacterized protein n=1 Tax=Zea mays TaxID=4577 RepID=B6SR87_MAIZE|nr:hypothetical protein [Zea mays]|eukprot:NP_001142892.1 uncharacterized protein LOC100275313 [Zea mays]
MKKQMSCTHFLDRGRGTVCVLEAATFLSSHIRPGSFRPNQAWFGLDWDLVQSTIQTQNNPVLLYFFSSFKPVRVSSPGLGFFYLCSSWIRTIPHSF